MHVILDTAEQKGTGKWTSQVALDLGIPGADHRRCGVRPHAERPQEGAGGGFSDSDRDRHATFTGRPDGVHRDDPARPCTARRSAPTRRGSSSCARQTRSINWDLQFRHHRDRSGGPGASSVPSSSARSRKPTSRNPALANLLLDPYFAGATATPTRRWRKVVAAAVENGIPVPAFMSALSYYDSYRSATLPANLLQAQRDYFGAHTYRRVDKEGVFHTQWEEGK